MPSPEIAGATEKLEGFEDFVHTVMRDWKVPGLAIAIVKDGDVIFSRGFGLRNVAQSLEVTPQTRFPIGSCTKAFTTMAMGMLVDEGKLDWDTPVRTYLPSFTLQDLFASERMTPRDLVTHRSGLPGHDLMWYRSHWSRQELFDRLQYLEPSKDFRAVLQYQNLMYMAAGYLVDQVAGTSWEEVVRTRILEPLGMTSSNFSVALSEQCDDYALPYREEQDAVKEIPFYDDFEAVAPAGAIVSNVIDMSKWLLLHLNKGKHGDAQLISEGQLTQMHTPQMVMPELSMYKEITFSSYALGWVACSYRGHTMLWHTGGIDGFSALAVLLPEHNAGMVVLTNLNEAALHSVVAWNACDRLLGLEESAWSERLKKQGDEAKKALEKTREEGEAARRPDTHPSHLLDAYTGEFGHPAYGVITITLDDGQLQAHFNSMTLELKHYHYDIFTCELFDLTVKLSFSTNLKGDIESVSGQFEEAVKAQVFTRKPAKDKKAT